MEDRMDKLIELFNELGVSESTLLDIISDENQSIDITLAALISLLDLWVGDVTGEDFYEYTGIAFDTLLTHMSQYSDTDEDDVIKNSLYRGILKHAAENLNTIYSDDPEAIQGDLKGFFNAYADAVNPKIAAAGERIQGAASQDVIKSDLLEVLESLGLDEDQRVEVVFSIGNFLIENVDKEAETEWAWPPNLNYDAIPNPNANPNSTDWKQESVLKIHGYTVGKSRDAWHKDKRRRLLDDVMRKQLPSYVTDLFGDEYGEPMTAKRLQKLAWLLYHNAQRFLQQRNSERYAVAIEDYEEDLEFLFQTFYEEEELKFQSPHLSWPWE
jgi:hypothetical protein